MTPLAQPNPYDFAPSEAQADDEYERFELLWVGKAAARLEATESPPCRLEFIPEKSMYPETTENLFIEGDSLPAMKLLLGTYSEKVRMIYIDPPYNTGRSFIYNDDFSIETSSYLERAGGGDCQDAGHSDEQAASGRLHSDWLSMMFPRLILARHLLAEDGVIFISIDDNEVHNLRMIMNEVFGESNFVATAIWEKKASPQNDARWLSDNHDYVLIYAKNKRLWRPEILPRTKEANARYKNLDNDSRGPWTSSDLTVKTYNPEYDYEIITPSGRLVVPPRGRCWGMPRSRFNQLVEEGRIWFGRNGDCVPRLKRFLSEVKKGMTPKTLWPRSEVGDNQEARRALRDLFGDIGVFDTPKPVRLIKRMLQIGTTSKSGDIILDFFAGSCSTAHAILELNYEDLGNRRFIMIQTPEPVPRTSRAYGMDFRLVSEIGAERIRRVSKSIRSKLTKNPHDTSHSLDLGFRFMRETYPWNHDG